MNAARGARMDGDGAVDPLGHKGARTDEKVGVPMDGDGPIGPPRRRLIEAEIGKPFDELTDEDWEWVRRVEAMDEDDARRAISRRLLLRMIKEFNRMDYEHILTQIP